MREKSVLQRPDLSSSTSLSTSLWKLAVLSKLSGTLGLSTYLLDDLSANDWQVPVYSQWQTSTSLSFSFDSLLASLDCRILNFKFLVLAFKNLGSSKAACLVLSFFFSAPFSMSVIPAFNHSLIHTSYKQTSPLLLLWCPNLCTDFLNSASCCDAHRQKAKYKCLDWEVTSYGWQVFLYLNETQNKTLRKKGQHNIL